MKTYLKIPEETSWQIWWLVNCSAGALRERIKKDVDGLIEKLIQLQNDCSNLPEVIALEELKHFDYDADQYRDWRERYSCQLGISYCEYILIH